MRDFNLTLEEMIVEVYGSDLSFIESYADENNLISSEQQLSDMFDDLVKECDQMERIDYDDTCMLSEWFNDWSDMLCKDGQLHDIQYHEYCYVNNLF